MLNFSFFERVRNFFIQLFLLPVSLLFQLLYGSSLVIIIIALSYNIELLLTFVSGMPIIWDIAWGFLGISQIKKRHSLVGASFDDTTYTYSSQENVEKYVKDTSGNILGTYTTKQKIEHYGESDKMIGTRFLLQLTLLRRVISILVSFFAIFSNSYAVSTRPINSISYKKNAYIYFDIIKPITSSN